jgi:mono/diheme cytochrome c family protein
MPDELDSAPAVDPKRWALQLVYATLAIALVTGALFYYTTRAVFGRAGATPAAPAVDPRRNVVSVEHGLAVYANNCATCHGPAGLGDGVAGAALNPKPRDFTSGWFKLGTTRSGLPSEDDLVATLRHGMLPAAMPPWTQLTDGEVRSAAIAVRHLAIEGRVARRLARDKACPPEKARQEARAQLDPGPVIVLPPKPTSFDLARGERFYMANCAACHDPDGRGRLREDLVDNDENPIAARDFTTGAFKGGGTVEDIAMRIARGIPGTPMPANPAISADDLWSTAAYVRRFAERRAAPATMTTVSEAPAR